MAINFFVVYHSEEKPIQLSEKISPDEYSKCVAIQAEEKKSSIPTIFFQKKNPGQYDEK